MTDSPKPISSEAEYDKALVEVERLWEAKCGTPEGDRLDILVTLIEAYEDKHYPMPMDEKSSEPSSREH
jgi:HTH-type transcriptional regulator/antitoxin HigA